jgi:membrane fusion protein, multidrug efflux system
MPMRIERLTAATLLATGLLTLTAGCGGKKQRGQGPVPVTVATAELRSVPNQIEASGSVEPIQTVSVQSQVTGVLTRVAFREGADVTAGQLLFQIDPRPFQAALDQARAALMRDRAQAAKAVADADRYRDLLTKEYVTQADYEEKQAGAGALLSTVRADSASVENARLNVEYATIRAPIAGRTGSLLVHEGNLVRAGSAEPLVVINTLRPILVRFPVPERYLDQLLNVRARRAPVSVRQSGDDPDSTQGALSFVDNNVDAATGTILCKAEFQNGNGSLWPGEFVTVRVVLSVDSHVCVIPAQAVTASQGGTIVFVVRDDGKVDARPVTVARQDDQVAVIAKGVSPGERVVTDGQFRLAPGAKVQIKGAGESNGGARASAGSGASANARSGAPAGTGGRKSP